MTARLLTLDETAAVLGVSPRTARRIVATGALPAFRHGARIVRIRDVDLAAYIARGVTAANPRPATGRPAGVTLEPGARLWS